MSVTEVLIRDCFRNKVLFPALQRVLSGVSNACAHEDARDNNSGSINVLGSPTEEAHLFIDKKTTLQGPGAVVLSDSSNNYIFVSGGAAPENAQTIEGAGNFNILDNSSLTLHNDFGGIINATGFNGLVINGLGSTGAGDRLQHTSLRTLVAHADDFVLV